MPPLLRLVGFFALAWVLLGVLQRVPAVGGLFRGFFGFWIVLILLSVGFERGSRWLLRRRKLQAELRSLGNVDSAHNQGKLGSLLLAHGRAAEALEALERASEGEPEVAEWHYRRGQALLAAGRADEAVVALERAGQIDEEHAYGGVQLALAEAHQAGGASERALERLATFERNHGPSPESAYRRGLALRAAGRKGEAAAAFAEVARLAEEGPRYQRKDHGRWVRRAALARLG